MLLRKQQLGRKRRWLWLQLWVRLRRLQLWRMQLRVQLWLQQQLHPRSLLLSRVP